jgi:large subunit ribosomal protein L24
MPARPAEQARPSDIRTGDQVLVLTGKDAGKRGTVSRVVRPDRVVIDGVNVAKRHQKPRARQGRNDRSPRVQQGGIIDIALPLHASNVMIVCQACGRPTRVGHQRQPDGRSIRVCRHCGEGLTREART